MDASADLGLLSPVWAATPVAAATGDAALIQALLDVEAAWVATQASDAPDGVTLAHAADAGAAERAADATRYDPTSLASRTPDGANVLIPLLKDYRALVAAENGSPVAAVHRGATSQDVIDTALALLAARAAALILADLEAAADALASLAVAHRDDVCIARSLTQHALPDTVGHRFARWLTGVNEAWDALHRVTSALPVQWGGAAGTLASLVDALAARGAADPVGGAEALVAGLAARLGLSAPAAAWHTRRAPFTRLGAALAEAVAAAGKIAADVLILARPEVGELAEPREEGKGGSSAMPHKRNPVLSVQIREAALEAPGHLSTLFLASGTAVDERPDGAWHAEWQALRSLLRLAGGAAQRLRALTEGLQVFPDRSLEVEGIFGELVLSERVSARVSPLLDGGKEAVDTLVARSLDTGASLCRLLRETVPASALSDAALEELFDPSHYLGVAPREVDRLVAAHRARKDTA